MSTINKRIKWRSLSVMLIFFAVAIWTVIFNFSWGYLFMAIILWKISLGLGLAGGYHRLLTHRSYQVPKWLEYAITVCGTLALQGPYIPWVATHTEHHAFTDKEGDPHSPQDGWLHSYLLWMIYNSGLRDNPEYLEKYAPRLCKDPFHRFLSKFWWLPSVCLALLLFYFGGFVAVQWGIFVPVVFGLINTWCVNWRCHTRGWRMFDTDDQSTNNWLVAWFTMGEGWHNNHHDQPNRARHGLKWYQFDEAWYYIRVFEMFGLAKNINMTPSKRIPNY